MALATSCNCGGSGETRTRDQRIKSPLLYRLSYRPSKALDFSTQAPLSGKPLHRFCAQSRGAWASKSSIICAAATMPKVAVTVTLEP